MGKFTLSPSMESLNSKNGIITIPMKWNIFGKECKANVEFAMNPDGSFDPKMVEAFNKFFVKLPELLKANMKLLIEHCTYDSPKPLTEDQIKKYFDHVQECFVRRDSWSVSNGPGKGYTKGEGIIAHCSLEWNADAAETDYCPVDVEHGDGFAMCNGKILMGKPGDFY